jgi:hypothetical protein
MNFTEFKNGPAGSLFAGLGKEWADLLQSTGCFEDLRRALHRLAARFAVGRCGGVADQGRAGIRQPSLDIQTSLPMMERSAPRRTSSENLFMK